MMIQKQALTPVLEILAFGEPVRLTEPAKAEPISQPGVIQLVTALERDGLVERRPDPDNGQAVLIHITDAGRRICHARRSERDAHLSPLLVLLTPEERQAIARALLTIVVARESAPRSSSC